MDTQSGVPIGIFTHNAALFNLSHKLGLEDSSVYFWYVIQLTLFFKDLGTKRIRSSFSLSFLQRYETEYGSEVLKIF